VGGWFGHLVAGNVNLVAVAWLLVGSVPGVIIGTALVLRVPDRALRILLGVVLVLSGVKLTDVPGADWVAGGGLVAMATAVAVTVAARRLVARRTPAVDTPGLDRL
jgi:hypothetical protein